ncbi:ATP-binding protein [uncultured Jannaschia sp.]|uniref:hybrid sensor histidine kinase/response regulator n=1 Tax=uncultured Jannaschia sp. TaxID=293347 RepID=UPI00262B1E1D|nr:ATP-binding protein [uncultured Jannaschia sp.]
MQLLAHDIRSAVSDVIGGLRLMNRETLPEAALVQHERVQAASELLARLVEELLGGTPRVARGHVGNLDLHRFLTDEFRRWHGATHGSGTWVTLELAPNLPRVVRLDLLSLRRVLANLMGNALRHAEGGQIRLAADLTDGDHLRICVSDDGPGIPADLMPRIFEPATRGSRSAAGTGMGLHIAAAQVSDMGGEIKAANRETGGAQLTVRFPREVWKRPGQSIAGLPDLRGVRVLVADDSGTNRTLVNAMLTRMGAECELAVDGIEALNWLARERFDLAIVDIEMPALGGLEVLRSERLRQARGIAPPMSMVAMTAYVLGDNGEAILEAGADGILAKPLDGIESFGRAIRHYLDIRPDASDWTPDRAPALSAITLAELMQAAGPDHQDQLLARLREDLARVEIDLEQALEGDDALEVEAQTHILLSLSTAVGALPTEAATRRLNEIARARPVGAMRNAGRVCLARLAELRRALPRADLLHEGGEGRG